MSLKKRSLFYLTEEEEKKYKRQSRSFERKTTSLVVLRISSRHGKTHDEMNLLLQYLQQEPDDNILDLAFILSLL